jgi:phosphatidate cytidylyltransferase
MTRIISGVVLAAAVVAAILFLPLLALRVIGVVVALLAALEYLNIVRPAGTSGSARMIPVLLIVAVTSWQMLLPGPSTLIGLLILAFGWLAVDVLLFGLSVHDAATRFVAPWYVGMPIGMLISVCGINGPLAALLLLATVVVSDSAQYYSGRAFGKRPLAPTISPKKTIEGALGGVVFGTLFMALAGPRVLPGKAPVSMAVLGFAIVALGICGDLFESRLKRVAGMKDSSALIPGHGGVLDRIDALLFAAPAYYLFLR